MPAAPSRRLRLILAIGLLLATALTVWRIAYLRAPLDAEEVRQIAEARHVRPLANQSIGLQKIVLYRDDTEVGCLFVRRGNGGQFSIFREGTRGTRRNDQATEPILAAIVPHDGRIYVCLAFNDTELRQRTRRISARFAGNALAIPPVTSREVTVAADGQEGAILSTPSAFPPYGLPIITLYDADGRLLASKAP